MIVKLKDGWVVKSENGKTLSRVYPNRKDAEKRLQEIEYFKHKK